MLHSMVLDVEAIGGEWVGREERRYLVSLLGIMRRPCPELRKRQLPRDHKGDTVRPLRVYNFLCC